MIPVKKDEILIILPPRKAIFGLESEIFRAKHYDIGRIFEENDTKSRGYVNLSV